MPDLELFPTRYQVAKRVSFQAGLELPFLHLSMVAMAYLEKIGLVKNWAPLSKAIVSNLFLPFGSDRGAIEVLVSGQGQDGKAKQIKWTFYAPKGNGPYIPTLSTIIMARKLLAGNTQYVGAKPCVGLLTLDDFTPHFSALDIYFVVQLSES